MVMPTREGASSVSTAVPISTTIPGREARPSDVFISLVDSLYKDGGTFLVGTILVTGPAFIIYWKTGEILLLACALAIVLVACLRGLLMYAYLRMRSTVTSLESAKRWERRYLTGATVTHTLLGVWCFVAFSQSSDPFVYFFSFSVTIIYAAGIFGRNFANPRFVFVRFFACGRLWRLRFYFTEIPIIGFTPAFSLCPFSGLNLWQIDCAARYLKRRLHRGRWSCSQPVSMRR
jgi:hypothetical protein